jgi:lipoprotein-anchoring transpeptidase ErfK/SrfK
MRERHHLIISFFTFFIGFISSYNMLMSIENGNMERVFAIQNEYGSVIEKAQTDEGPSIINKTINKKEVRKYIYIDLRKMTVSTVEEIGSESIVLNTYTIISKGKPGSYYETPTGSYDIKSKEYNHFSSLGAVYMPYSMQFYGNFFIHGIPYHPDGTRVSSAYSGGCIRMNDNDAQEIFAFADYNTKVILLNATLKTISTDNQMNTTEDSQKDLGQIKSKSLIDALISLEFLDQERVILLHNEKVKIKDTTQNIVDGDLDALQVIKNTLGETNYNNAFLEKAYAVGIDASLENSSDRVKLFEYIKNNKSYLLQYI